VVSLPASARLLAVAAGLAADGVLGEPPAWHPVAGFGAAMTALEARVYGDRRGVGAAYTAVGIGAATLCGVALARAGRRPVGWCSEAVVVAATAYLAIGGRALKEAAEGVGGALGAGDLRRARALLPALVGRDPEGLDEGGVARAAIESVAENTVDAIVAPAFWALLGGAPGAFAYRAANTLDAMVGHRCARYVRFGWASARVDDLANWIPARLTALLVMLVRPRAARPVWRAIATQASAHPSPNAGVSEAAFAAALGVRLGGINSYGGRSEERPPLGEGAPPGVHDVERACRLSRDVTRALVGALVAAVGVARVHNTASRRRS
jgi:adenosylcobinamide-phosphate synthase